MKKLFLMIISMMLTGAAMAQVDRASVRFDFAPSSAVINPETTENLAQLIVLDSLVADFIKVPASDRYLVITSFVSETNKSTQLSAQRQKEVHEQFNTRLRQLGHHDAHAIFHQEAVPDGDSLSLDGVALTVRYLNQSAVASRAEASVPVVADAVDYPEYGQAPYGYTEEGYRILGYRVVSVDTVGVKQLPAVAPVPVVKDTAEVKDALQSETPVDKGVQKDSDKVQRIRLPHIEWSDVSSNFALKTNMLYDLALVPNIGVEYYLGKQWSLSADWMYAWWSKDAKHRYWRMYGGNAEVRYWFGNRHGDRRLTGHHVGAYAGILTYDVEFGGTGYMGEKWSYMAGLSYGYAFPIAKRLNLDFSLGLGYFGGNYYEYDYNDGAQRYFWQQTKKRKWFGPTRLECSLVWLLGK